MDLENLRRLLTASDPSIRKQGAMLGAQLWPDLDWPWRVLLLCIGCRLGVLGPSSLSEEDRCQIWHYLRSVHAGCELLPGLDRWPADFRVPVGGGRTLISITLGLAVPPDEGNLTPAVVFSGSDVQGLTVMHYDRNG